MSEVAVLESNCPDLTLISRGKVRDIYEFDENSLLFVASDRLSAFDVIMKNGIPGKGKILTQLSLFWFDFLKDTVKTHVIGGNFNEIMSPKFRQYASQLDGRSMLVKKLKILPVEAIVRGYIAGSGWEEYKKKGTICDIKLPSGLQLCEKLPEPLFTPSTKAEIGDHDMNIHPDKLKETIGVEMAAKVEELAIKIYKKAAEYALSKGIIIADTKFEFGVDENGEVVLADEVLTPGISNHVLKENFMTHQITDSSRFWPLDSYTVGQNQQSFDKQFVRDYLSSINFDKTNAIELPQEMIVQVGFFIANFRATCQPQRMNYTIGFGENKINTASFGGDAQALIMSLVVILVSEIGDKTFFIAAVMAMTNPRLLIFAAAMSALGVMTVLSAYLGHVVPNLISKEYTQLLASVLFFVFGLKMLKEGYEMKDKDAQEELEEVEQELLANNKEDDEMEKGEITKKEPEQSWMNLLHYFLSPVFVQTFILTFLAEWGDRSQIATIALAGTEDFLWVTLGSLVGHSVCTAIAVIAGRMIASRISVRTVTILGAVLFLIFGMVSLSQSVAFKN
ncbi:hypothetical protein HK098_005407 [Nowakowskiella sp. JEL0407]|nr:hypothetical protein HK098_005407 [Nowakowskiella sp. JEL0407]